MGPCRDDVTVVVRRDATPKIVGRSDVDIAVAELKKVAERVSVNRH